MSERESSTYSMLVIAGATLTQSFFMGLFRPQCVRRPPRLIGLSESNSSLAFSRLDAQALLNY